MKNSTASYIFGVVGLGMLVGTFFIYTNTKNFLATSEETQGIVDELLDVYDKKSHSYLYKPSVSFTDKKGNSYKFTTNSSSNPPMYHVNEEVTVLYDPLHPTDAKIKGFFSLWGGSLILGGIGSVFFGGSLLYHLNKKRSQTD